MNVNEIQDLIKFVAKAGVNEVEIEKKDFKIGFLFCHVIRLYDNFEIFFLNFYFVNTGLGNELD